MDRKISIIVPHNETGVYDLDHGVEESENMTVLNISDNINNQLWDIGFFDDLGKELGLYFSQYEDDWIKEDDNLNRCLHVISKYIKEYPEMDFLSQIKSLFSDALKYRTSIFFCL
ncbi:hypothetical protein [Acinetobacter pittii]|uniref:hypothetical protein n=1 Tax=Acinetobacter pittii TaxID=48296 RepID=UPI00300B727D